MRTTAPTHEELADHTGKPRPAAYMPLSYEAARLGLAFHEAGHAVLSMAYGIHVASSEVIAWATDDDGGWAVTGKTALQARNVSPWHYAAQCAVGELAHAHYLLTYGLWTPERAAACRADHDRELAIDVLAESGFRLGRDDVPRGGKSWGMARGMARRKMYHLWREITAVANALNDRTLLTGDEIADLTGLSNAAGGGL
ncbi:hypothetical protein [Streptomyces luteireticuli]|uniref:Peptidase M41 domain-containing protein n=1 Tax=Streptomyces luteireticuli TaxID=173858 RepID=A0ABN0Y8M5_9ACTN